MAEEETLDYNELTQTQTYGKGFLNRDGSDLPEPENPTQT